ncbi:MAG: glycosyl hydrolase [Lentisphaeria bacterium]
MNSKLDIYRHTYEAGFEELFNAPPALFRGAPFWSWNTKLDKVQLRRQIETFKSMGIGGFHMHSRVGMNTPYLSDEFMDAVKACVDKAQDEEMLAWLYDEDRWPSGAAGGLVTKDPRFRARHLLFTPRPYESECRQDSGNFSGALSGRTGNGHLLACYAVRLDDGVLLESRRLQRHDDAEPGEDVWFAYLETAKESAWFNNQTYLDTLNPKAVETFIEVTHERYCDVVGERFGSVIPGIFTDEPQFTKKKPLAFAAQPRDVIMPFTEDLADTYQQAYGEDLLDRLPEIFWELPDGQPSVTRYRYHDHIAERFAHAFADTIGDWCEKQGIVLTGHLMEEPTLESQTHALGDAMRSYRSFQLPGIDMLCDRREFTTAKQAQSAAHQYGRNGVLSELYGVTGWDFDFSGHKCQGDWQAALGVTVRVHHLSWVSMEGEAKRDYPSSILHQSPWWEKYSTVEDHFARVNVAMTRGKPHVRVGMLHPVESFWLCYGPADQTEAERNEREYTFRQMTEWLLFGLVDFDYLCESLLPELSKPRQTTSFQVGTMAYDTVIVPPMRTIRSTTLDRLEAFVDAGGELLFVGEIPTLVDAVPSPRPRQLAERAATLEFSQSQILKQLGERREIEVIRKNGSRAVNLVHQIREKGSERYVFLCNSAQKSGQGQTTVRIRGSWDVERLDTATGRADSLPATCHGEWTEIDWFCHPHGHLLIRLTPSERGSASSINKESAKQSGRPVHLQGPVPVTLSEPNTLLLDQAEWRLNDGEWQPREEILRLDDVVRDTLELPRRGGRMAQPWTESEDNTVLGTLDLRFTVNCEVPVKAPRLAIEQPEYIELWVDGHAVQVEDHGCWVDDAIRTLSLPNLDTGIHELVIRIAYHRKSNVEWCYLLGDFGVCLAGRDALITAPIRELAFGDWTRQGLPFYTGNLTYHCQFEVSAPEEMKLRIPHFSGAMLDARLDAGRGLDIAYAPYEAVLGTVQAGSHKLDITLYGNRHNAFGPLHWAEPSRWVGPGAWRTSGNAWSYEYSNMRSMGICTAPRLYRILP